VMLPLLSYVYVVRVVPFCMVVRRCAALYVNGLRRGAFLQTQLWMPLMGAVI
jgi:hypothetical protein